MNSHDFSLALCDVLRTGRLDMDLLDALLEDGNHCETRIRCLVALPLEAYRLQTPPSLRPEARSIPPDPPSRSRARGMEREEEVRFSKRLEFFRLRLEKAMAAHFTRQETPECAEAGPLCCTGRVPSGSRCRACEEGKAAPPAFSEDREDPLQHWCRAYNQCRAEFVERNLHLVSRLIQSYRFFKVPLADLMQEGSAALIRAVERFDWRRGVRLRTYAELWIRQAVERAIAAHRSLVRIPGYLQQKLRRAEREGRLPAPEGGRSSREISKALDIHLRAAGGMLESGWGHFSLDAAALEENLRDLSRPAPPEDGHIPLPREEYTRLRKRLTAVLENLTDQERFILRHRFGLEGAETRTYDVLGKALGISRERVRQIHARTLEKLRRMGHVKELEQYL